MRSILHHLFRVLFVMVYLIILWTYYDLILPSGVINDLALALITIGALSILFPSRNTESKQNYWIEGLFFLGILYLGSVLIEYDANSKQGYEILLNLVAFVLLIVIVAQQMKSRRGNEIGNIAARSLAIIIIAVMLGVILARDISILKWVVSGIFLFLVGGYFWGEAIIQEKLDIIARIVIGFMIGIVMLPVILYYLSLLGVSIQQVTILIVNSIFALSGYIIYKVLLKRKRKEQD